MISTKGPEGPFFVVRQRTYPFYSCAFSNIRGIHGQKKRDMNHLDPQNHKPDPGVGERFQKSLGRGLLTGFHTSWTLIKVMVPTMAAVQFMKLTGLLSLLADLTSPFMNLFRLPGEASLVLITGGLVNIYAAIAVAVNIPLDPGGMTVLAIMVLIAHNLIVETAVQKRAGTPASIMLTARLTASVAAGLVFSRIVSGDGHRVIQSHQQSGDGGWKGVLAGNAVSLVKIAVIIVSLMILVEAMREFGLMDRITRALELPMKALGMDRRTSFVAAVGLLLGLAYGAGLIIEEADRSGIGKREILATNLFLGTSHALVEDSLIFAAVGAHLGWIVLGRLAFGIIFLKIATPLVLFVWKPVER